MGRRLFLGLSALALLALPRPAAADLCAAAAPLAATFSALAAGDGPWTPCAEAVAAMCWDDGPRLSAGWRAHWADWFPSAPLDRCPRNTFVDEQVPGRELAAVPLDVAVAATGVVSFGRTRRVVWQRLRFWAGDWNCRRLDIEAVLYRPDPLKRDKFSLILLAPARPGATAPTTGPTAADLALADELSAPLLRLEDGYPPNAQSLQGRAVDVSLAAFRGTLTDPAVVAVCRDALRRLASWSSWHEAAYAQRAEASWTAPGALILRRAARLIQQEVTTVTRAAVAGPEPLLWPVFAAATAERLARPAPLTFFGAWVDGGTLLQPSALFAQVMRSGVPRQHGLVSPASAVDDLLLVTARAELDGPNWTPRLGGLKPMFAVASSDPALPLEQWATLGDLELSSGHNLWIAANVTDTAASPWGAATRLAYLRHRTSSAGSFDFRAEFLHERADHDDWQVSFAATSDDPLRQATLWWSCDTDADGDWNDERWQAEPATTAAEPQTLRLPGANRCPRLAYWLEGIMQAREAYALSTPPRFPKGTVGLEPTRDKGGFVDTGNVFGCAATPPSSSAAPNAVPGPLGWLLGGALLLPWRRRATRR